MFNSAPHHKPSHCISLTGILTIISFIPKVSFSGLIFHLLQYYCQGRKRAGKYLYAENFHLVLYHLFHTDGYSRFSLLHITLCGISTKTGLALPR